MVDESHSAHLEEKPQMSNLLGTMASDYLSELVRQYDTLIEELRNYDEDILALFIDTTLTPKYPFQLSNAELTNLNIKIFLEIAADFFSDPTTALLSEKNRRTLGFYFYSSLVGNREHIISYEVRKPKSMSLKSETVEDYKDLILPSNISEVLLLSLPDDKFAAALEVLQS